MSNYDFPQPRLLIDAGAFALSKDLGPAHLGYKSYGVIKGHPDLIITSISQEIGVIIGKDSKLNLNDYPIGSLLEIIPNHSCLSTYCYDHLQIVSDNGKVIDRWITCPRHF